MSNWKLIFTATALAFAATACKKTSSDNRGVSVAPPPSSPAPSAPIVSEGSLGGASVNSPAVRRTRKKKSTRGGLCTRGAQGAEKMAASVTHYYIAPGTSAGDFRCRNGFGYFGQPAMAGTCLHPCRSLAADPRYYRPGEILYFPSLVGLTCGSGRNKMVHDGYMVVTDNGNPEAINIEGRFGLFWGKCNQEQNGFCLDQGATALDFALTFSQYCRAWRPQDPTYNENVKLSVYNTVRAEAIRRGDNHAASKFDLDALIGIGIDADGILFRRSGEPASWNPFADGGN